jgi:LacI family transcriptional regulator
MPPAWWRGDGILSLITNPKDVEALHLYPTLPLVDLSKGWISDSMPEKFRASGRGRPRIYYDNALTGRMAAEHFLERGFKHIAYLNRGNYWMERERIPSFRQTIEAGGSQYHEIPYYKCFLTTSSLPLQDYQRAHQWLMKALRELPKPVGIALSSDNVSLQLLQACDDANLNVPEEVAVLGCENDPMICDYTPVPLSSIDTNWEYIGFEGAKMLDRLMDGKRVPRKPVLIPPKGVVTRVSTNILAVPDLHIARAVRFIWEHYPENIGTPEIAKAAGLNRRKLERDFRKHLGRSLNEEINQIRIECAKKRLIETNLKIYEVAQQCGFNSIYYFSKTFSRLTGIRPSLYRRRNRPAI